MTLGDGVKAAALLFVAAVAQVSVFSQVHVFGAVPDVLLSGHHAEIERWRREQAAQRTRRRRPDLLQDRA